MMSFPLLNFLGIHQKICCFFIEFLYIPYIRIRSMVFKCGTCHMTCGDVHSCTISQWPVHTIPKKVSKSLMASGLFQKHLFQQLINLKKKLELILNCLQNKPNDLHNYIVVLFLLARTKNGVSMNFSWCNNNFKFLYNSERSYLTIVFIFPMQAIFS